MKNFFYTFVLVFFVLLMVPNFTFSASKETVVAKVGGIPVTIFELGRAVQEIAPLRTSFHSGLSAEKENEIKGEALDGLIERAYKVRGAIEQELSVDIALLNKKIAEIRKKFKSEKEFEKAFGDEGSSQYRASLYREMLAKRAVEVNVDAKVNVPESAVREYYDTNKHTYLRPPSYRASHILIKVDPASNSDEIDLLKLKSESLLKRAQSGEDFYNLAYYNSDDRTKMVGGDIGVFHEGQTVPVFEKAVKSLEVGEISDLVRSRWGFHIVKLTDKKPSRQLEFDDVKLKIRTDLEKVAKDELYQEWIASLKKKFKVENILNK